MREWIESLDPNTISVILPTYNRLSFKKSIDSVIGMKVPDGMNVEIIVVDDGSQQEVTEGNMYYCNDIPNIKYIKLNENTGTVSIPRNIGISHCTGAYIAHHDDDCFALPHKLSVLIPPLQESRVQWTPLSFGNILVSNQTHCIQKDFSGWLKDDTSTQVGMDNGQFVYKAEVYERIQPVLAINACDWELYRRISEAGGKFIHVNEYVYNYSFHSGNISSTPKPYRTDPNLVVKNFVKYFKDNQFSAKLLKGLLQ